MSWDPGLPGVVTLPDGVLVRGWGRGQPPPAGPPPEFALHLGRRLRGETDPAWPVEWLEWPDFRLPKDDAAAVAAIRRLHATAAEGRRVHVGCRGGNGRTGTVIACLAVLAGVPAADAVAWTRREYRPHAVETRGQKRWVEWFGAQLPPAG
jgi:protein-tyrosine phosphatase